MPQLYGHRYTGGLVLDISGKRPLGSLRNAAGVTVSRVVARCGLYYTTIVQFHGLHRLLDSSCNLRQHESRLSLSDGLCARTVAIAANPAAWKHTAVFDMKNTCMDCLHQHPQQWQLPQLQRARCDTADGDRGGPKCLQHHQQDQTHCFVVLVTPRYSLMFVTAPLAAPLSSRKDARAAGCDR